MPALPQELLAKYQEDYQLSEYDAEQLVSELEISDYFEAAIQHTTHFKAVSNWINGPIRSIMNDQHLRIDQTKISPLQLGNIVELVASGLLNFSVASNKLLPAVIDNPGQSPIELARALNLLQTDNTDLLEEWVNQALESMPDKVQAYQKGKKGLIGLFVGEVKKRSKGKADPQKVMDILKEKLG